MKTWKFIEGRHVETAIGSLPTIGKHQLEPLSSISKEKGVSYNMLEDHEFYTPFPELHRHETDVFIGYEGEIEFILGGKGVDVYIADDNDNEIKAREIIGGTKFVLKVGDFLEIPAGVWHAHTATHGRAYIIKKIPEHGIVPLEQVPGWKP